MKQTNNRTKRLIYAVITILCIMMPVIFWIDVLQNTRYEGWNAPAWFTIIFITAGCLACGHILFYLVFRRKAKPKVAEPKEKIYDWTEQWRMNRQR